MSTLKQNKTRVKFVRAKRQRQIVNFVTKIHSSECMRGLNRFLPGLRKARRTFIFLIEITPVYNMGWRLDSAVGIVIRYAFDDRRVGVRVSVRPGTFPSPLRTGRTWGPPIFLSDGYKGLSTRNLPAGIARPAHKTDNLAAIFETIV
jgi:hypothetical protein